jgi:hypothetical protein
VRRRTEKKKKIENRSSYEKTMVSKCYLLGGIF